MTRALSSAAWASRGALLDQFVFSLQVAAGAAGRRWRGARVAPDQGTGPVSEWWNSACPRRGADSYGARPDCGTKGGELLQHWRLIYPVAPEYGSIP